MFRDLFQKNRRKLGRKGLSLLMAFFTVFSWILPSFAQEVNLYEEVEGFAVTRGADYKLITRFTSLGWQQINVLKIDLHSDNIGIDTISPLRGLGPRDSLGKMVQESGAVAGINGDFFIMATPSSPVGIQIRDGRMISSPSNRQDMASFGLTWDNIPTLFHVEFAGKVLSTYGSSFDIGGINKVGDSYGKIYIYSEDYGDTTPDSGPVDKTFAVIKDNTVEDVFDGNIAAIPENGMVLVGRGAAAEFIKYDLSIGDPLNLQLDALPDLSELKMALGGGAVLVEDGDVPGSFSHNISGVNPRSAVGFTRDGGTLILAAVDGRQGNSRGMTQEELANLMLELGAHNALNLDGGGSTTMAIRPLGEEKPHVANTVSGGTQRLIANGIGVFSKSAPGQVRGLKIVADAFDVPLGGHRRFGVLAFDENFNPVEVDPSKVRWSADKDLGGFEGDVFTAQKSGIGVVTASLGDINATQNLRVLNEISHIAVEPQRLQLKPEGKAVFEVVATDVDGFSAPVDPVDLSWELTHDLGTFVGNEFFADSEGSCAAIATFSGVHSGALVEITSQGDGIGVDPSLLPRQLPLYDDANSPRSEGGLKFAALGFPLAMNASQVHEETQNIALGISKDASAKFNVLASAKSTLDPKHLMSSGVGYKALYEGDSLFLFLDTGKGGIRATDYRQWIELQRDLMSSKDRAKNVFVVMDRTLDSFSDSLESGLLKKLLSEFAQNHDQDIWVLGGGAQRFTSEKFEGVHYISLPAAEAQEPSMALFSVNSGEISYRVVPLIESISAEVTGAKKGRETDLEIYGISPGGQRVLLAYPYAVDWKLSTDKLGSLKPLSLTFDARETGSLEVTATTAGISQTFDIGIADLTVIVDGSEVIFPDQQPFIDEHSRTMVPVRFVSQSLGAQVEWEDISKTVIIKQNGLDIRLKVGENTALVNGEIVAFDTKAVFKNDRTMVPLRFVSEVLGAEVSWEDATRTIIVEER